MTFSLGEDLLVRLVGGPGEREHLPVDVDGGEVGDLHLPRWTMKQSLVHH